MTERAKQKPLSYRREGSAMKVSLYLPNVPISDGIRAKNPKRPPNVARWSQDNLPVGNGKRW